MFMLPRNAFSLREGEKKASALSILEGEIFEASFLKWAEGVACATHTT
jgi:hypothetical protein